MYLSCMSGSGICCDLLPLETFFCSSPFFSESLSPDGARLARLKEISSEHQTLVWREIKSSQEKMIYSLTKADVAYFVWWKPDVLVWKDKAPHPTFWQYNCSTGATKQICQSEQGYLELKGITQGENRKLIFGVSSQPTAFTDLYEYHEQSDSLRLVMRNTDQIFEWVFSSSVTPVAGLRWSDKGEKEVMLFGQEPRILEHVGKEETLLLSGCDVTGDHVWLLSNAQSDVIHVVEWDLKRSVRKLLSNCQQTRYDMMNIILADREKHPSFLQLFSEKYENIPLTQEAKTIVKVCDQELGRGNYIVIQMSEKGGRALIRGVSDRSPQRAFIYDGATQTLQKLNQGTPSFPEGEMCSMHPFNYVARDGVSIPAYLTLPLGNPPFPLIVFPHGGPRMRTFWGFDPRVQFFASRGYAILQPNFRGSRGYGKAWMNAGNLQWGTGVMQNDLTDGVVQLIHQGTVDAHRVAIMGGSYGGYAALAGLCFTPEIYAAGICLFGSSDLSQKQSGTPIKWEPFVGEYGSYIADETTTKGKWRCYQQSPIHHVDQIKAPLFLYHGQKDTRIPFIHAKNMFHAMSKANKPVVFYSFTDEEHGFNSLLSEMTVYRQMEKFLAKYLKGKETKNISPEIKRKLSLLQCSGDR
ncbi:MAG: prolyl oligopeptidase family serine peptidase [Akkermansia sp.]